MAAVHLSFVERKTLLKWYWKYENITEVQRQWRREFGTPPPTRRTIARIRDKFEADGTVNDVHKGRSGRRRTATTPESCAAVLQHFVRSPQKSVTQGSRDSAVSRSSVRRILKRANWKVYIPRLLHQMNEDDPDRRLEYCEWFQHMGREDVEFAGKFVWTDEAQFKLNGIVNRHNCVYWAPENPNVHIDRAVNLSGVSVWCGLSVRGLIGPFFFEDTITGAAYLEMLQTNILPAIQNLYDDELFYMQQDGAPPHYHRDVRLYLDRILPGRWVGRRGAIEYPPRSPDLTPLDFYLWGTVKNEVYRQRPRTIEELRAKIEEVCAAITPDTLTAVVRSAVQRHMRCIQVGGHHFEHIP